MTEEKQQPSRRPEGSSDSQRKATSVDRKESNIQVSHAPMALRILSRVLFGLTVIVTAMTFLAAALALAIAIDQLRHSENFPKADVSGSIAAANTELTKAIAEIETILQAVESAKIKPLPTK